MSELTREEVEKWLTVARRRSPDDTVPLLEFREFTALCDAALRGLTTAEPTSASIERIRGWLDRRGMLDGEMNALCDLAQSALVEMATDLEDFQRIPAERRKEIAAALRGLTLPCGHPVSLLVKSVESDAQWCELCDTRSQLRDALTMEREYREKLAAPAAQRQAVTDDEIMAVVCREVDALDCTRVWKDGTWKATTIFDGDAALLRCIRAVLALRALSPAPAGKDKP